MHWTPKCGTRVAEPGPGTWVGRCAVCAATQGSTLPVRRRPEPAAIAPTASKILFEKLPHRRRGHQAVERRRRQVAILKVGTLHADDHAGLRGIVTGALDQRAARRVAAFEGRDYVRVCVTHGETSETDVAHLIVALEAAMSQKE